MTDRRTDGQTDGRTDGRTDRQTENTICRAAWSQLKIISRTVFGKCVVRYMSDLCESFPVNADGYYRNEIKYKCCIHRQMSQTSSTVFGMDSHQSKDTIKCVLVGDRVGKICLFMHFKDKTFDSNYYIPTVGKLDMTLI